MDIRQLRYLVEIVETNFNLSETSQRIHVSQPALSQSIRRLEEEFNAELFTRSRGRLIGLTEVGESVYHDAMNVITSYDELIQNMYMASENMQGRIRIGIPPLVLSVLFTDVLAELITSQPRAKIEIVEEGAYELRRMLQTEEIDCAILLEPTDLPDHSFEKVYLFHDSLDVFMSKDHPLAVKDELDWSDLKGESFVMFDETYLIHHNVMRKFRSLNYELKIVITSKSWDFLLESVRYSKYLTILPRPIEGHYNLEDVVRKPLSKPLDWDVLLVYPKKHHYSNIEQLVQDKMKRHFGGGQKIINSIS